MSKAVETIFGTSATEVDVAKDGSHRGFVAEDPAGSFLLVGIADYDGHGSGSYLRMGRSALGAGRLGPPNKTGDDLAALVQGFTDDARNRSGAVSIPATSLPSFNQPPPDADGNITIGTDAPAETVMVGLTESDPINAAQRVFESGAPLVPDHKSFHNLHLRGGVRDHSDGNRITTTRGDKVEIIRGNYKLLVLGRQSTVDIHKDDDARRGLIKNSSGVELSGGLSDTDPGDLAFPDMNGAALDIEYVWGQDSDDTWAWTQTTIVGSENPDRSHLHPANYRLINRTWVDYQIDKLGSPDKRVSHVSEETYAHEMSTTIHAESCTTDTVAAELFSMTNAAMIVNRTEAGVALKMNCTLESGEADAGLAFLTLKAGVMMPTIQLGTVCDDKILVHIDNHFGIHVDTHAGIHVEDTFGIHTDTHAASHNDVHTGLHFEQHFCTHASYDQVAIEVKKGEFKVKKEGEAEIVLNETSVVGTEYETVIGAAISLANTYHISM